MISFLIDKQDNSEIIRDQIAGILLQETTEQQALAVVAGKDPADWKLRIYTERSNPWETFRDDEPDKSPVINVSYDSTGFDKSASNAMQSQSADGVFNIDIVATGISKDDGAGHVAGDQAAAIACQRASMLVRNILMASDYTYLGMRGTVTARWPQAITSYTPQSSDGTAEKIHVIRLVLAVSFVELSPQYVGDTLELITVNVRRREDGELYFTADYDHT